MNSQSQPAAVNGTVTVVRTLDAQPSRVFRAFADPQERSNWGAPSETATFIVEKADFLEGGIELVRCGDASDPRFLVESRYHRIIPDRLIVFTETVALDEMLLMVSLQTVTIESRAEGALCTVEIQLVSFSGKDMVRNTEAGQNGSLDNLSKYLAAAG